MRAFVVRARAAPTNSESLLAAVGQEAHTEILAHSLMNAIFVAQSHRKDVIVHLVLESTQDFSRTISFIADEMASIAFQSMFTPNFRLSNGSHAAIKTGAHSHRSGHSC